jgi:ribosomal protein L11 methyltransferase
VVSGARPDAEAVLIRLGVRVRREQAELVLAELLELAPGGVEEREDGDVVEYAVYGAPGELPELPDLRAAAGGALVEVTTTEVPDDWDERWKAFHRPVRVGGLLVRPPWEPPRDGLLDVVIDPAQAFGTGAHPTTRLCLELLLELEPSGALVDVGCGSGVLAIAAARLGWGPVLGVDHERASVQATLDNGAANGVAVQARRHDLLRDGPAPGAPTVLANLLRPLLLRVARDGFAGAPPDALVASGLLAHEGDEVAAAFARHGLRETARRHGGEWVALLLTR